MSALYVDARFTLDTERRGSAARHEPSAQDWRRTGVARLTKNGQICIGHADGGWRRPDIRQSYCLHYLVSFQCSFMSNLNTKQTMEKCEYITY